MGTKQSLYEMLGVAQGASVPELQAAYRVQVGELEAAKGRMPPQDFDFKSQLLKVALSTLSDPVSRLSYDAKLAAAEKMAQAAGRTGALQVTDRQAAAVAVASAETRADALALRADALSLRADAMMVRAGLELPRERASGGMLRSLAGGSVMLLRRTMSALGIVVVLGIGAYFFFRGDADSRRLAEQKAAEQTALQEYYQTHGVRPANMAELELMEAERRRRENETRQVKQNNDKADRDQRRFEEESQRIGRQAAEDLRRQQEYAQQQQEYQKQREAEIRLSQQREREYREQARLERERQQFREIVRETANQ